MVRLPSEPAPKRLRVAFIYELPPERMPWYARLDYEALAEIAEVRYVAPVANPDWRRVLGPRGWLPSPELWRTCLLYTSPSPRD